VTIYFIREVLTGINEESGLIGLNVIPDVGLYDIPKEDFSFFLIFGILRGSVETKLNFFACFHIIEDGRVFISEPAWLIDSSTPYIM